VWGHRAISFGPRHFANATEMRGFPAEIDQCSGRPCTTASPCLSAAMESSRLTLTAEQAKALPKVKN
jgi:hypothetical protein